jgi:rRNA-processing protein FCF1
MNNFNNKKLIFFLFHLLITKCVLKQMYHIQAHKSDKTKIGVMVNKSKKYQFNESCHLKLCLHLPTIFYNDTKDF